MAAKKPPTAPTTPSETPEPLSLVAAEREKTRAAIESTLRAVAEFVEAQPEHPSAPALLEKLVQAHGGLLEAERQSEQDARLERVAAPLLEKVLEIMHQEMTRALDKGSSSAPSASGKAAA